MSTYELCSDDTDLGMAVFGPAGIDLLFREQADAAGRTDEKLRDAKPEELLRPEALSLAAASGYLAAVGQVEVVELPK